MATQMLNFMKMEKYLKITASEATSINIGDKAEVLQNRLKHWPVILYFYCHGLSALVAIDRLLCKPCFH